MRIRRFVIWGVALLFAAASLAWIFYFPFRPDRVLRVVPPDAVLSSRHFAPASRLEVLLDGPLAAPLSTVLTGAWPASIETLRADPGLRDLIRRLGGTYVVTGYVPPSGAFGVQASIVFGAWIGGLMTHWVRFGWLDKGFDGFRVHRFKNNDRIWIGVFPDHPAGFRFVSFGIHEGVIAGSISDDPFAAMALLNALKRHAPLVPLVAPWGRERAPASAPDAFRVRVSGPSDASAVLNATLQTHDGTALSGQGVLEGDFPFPRFPAITMTGASAADDVRDTLHPLIGNAPALLMVARLALLPEGMDAVGAAADDWRPVLAAVTDLAPPGAYCGFWIAGGPYSGRMMRLRIPSVGFAFQTGASEAEVGGVARRLVDVLNMQFGLGLMAVPERDRRVFSVTTVSGGVLERLHPAERPAVALAEGWVLAVSSTEVLNRMLAARAAGGERPPWASEATGEGDEWFYGWAALGALHDVTSKVTAGYALYNLMQGGESRRLNVDPLLRRLAALDLLDDARLVLRHDADGRLEIRWAMKARREVPL